MRFIIILFSALCFAPHLIAQIPYFNIQFDYKNRADLAGLSCLETDSFYLIPVASSDFSSAVGDTSAILHINKFSGDIISNKINLFSGQLTHSLVGANGKLISLGQKYNKHDYIDSTDAFIGVYNSKEGKLDTFLHQSFGKIGWGDYPQRLLATSDGGIFTAGWSFPSAGPRQLLLLYKCDSNLQQQYFKLLGDENFAYFGNGSVEMPNGDIIVSGAHRYFVPGVQYTNDDALLVRIGPQGNVVWWQEIAGVGDTSELTIYDITRLPNGQLLGVGTKTVDPFIGLSQRYYWVMGLSEWGEIEWEKHYRPNEFSGWYKLVPSQDGHFYAAGGERDYATLIDSSTNLWSYKQYGSVSKISATGDLIWHRRYSQEKMNVHYDDFYNVMATADGGLLCHGRTYQDSTYQNAWIIKLDQFGCTEPGCDTVSGIVVLPVGDNDPLLISPNPANGPLRFSMKDGAAIQSVRLYDTGGRMAVQELTVSSPQFEVDMSGQPSGIYFASVLAGGVLYVRQVMVAR